MDFKVLKVNSNIPGEICSQGEIEREGRCPDGRLVELR